jgi:hypothetical protein
LATILNPRFRQKFFSLHYPDHNAESQALIEEAFDRLVEDSLAREPTPPPDEPVDSVETDDYDVFGAANDIPDKPSRSELDNYLAGQYPIKKDQSSLDWWKVCPSIFLILILLYFYSLFPPYENMNRLLMSSISTHRNTKKTFPHLPNSRAITCRSLPHPVHVSEPFPPLPISVRHLEVACSPRRWSD